MWRKPVTLKCVPASPIFLKARGLAPLDADLDVSAVFWSALFDGLILAWMINPEKMDIDKLAEGIFRMLWRGIAPDAASKAGE